MWKTRSTLKMGSVWTTTTNYYPPSCLSTHHLMVAAGWHHILDQCIGWCNRCAWACCNTWQWLCIHTERDNNTCFIGPVAQIFFIVPVPNLTHNTGTVYRDIEAGNPAGSVDFPTGSSGLWTSDLPVTGAASLTSRLPPPPLSCSIHPQSHIGHKLTVPVQPFCWNRTAHCFEWLSIQLHCGVSLNGGLGGHGQRIDLTNTIWTSNPFAKLSQYLFSICVQCVFWGIWRI